MILQHGLCYMLCNTWHGAVDEEIYYIIRNKGGFHLSSLPKEGCKWITVAVLDF